MQDVESPVFWGSFGRQRLAWACLRLDPMAAQHDYSHGPNYFYSLDPCVYLYLLLETGLDPGLG